jgi:hypothetical protein
MNAAASNCIMTLRHYPRLNFGFALDTPFSHM